MDAPKSRVFSLKRNNNPTCAAFCRNDNFAAVGTDSGRILLLPLVPNQAMKKFPGHKKSITAMDVRHAQDVIVTGSEDTTVQVLKGQEANVIRPNDGVIKFVSVAQELPLVLVVGEDGSPSVWNTDTLEPVILMKQFSSTITAAAMAPNGKLFAIASEENGCRLYNTTDGNPIVSIQAPEVVTSIAIAEKTPFMALGLIDGNITVYDYVHHSIVCEKELHRTRVVAVALHPTSNILVSSSSDGDLHVSNPLDLKPRFSVEGNEGTPLTIKFSQDGAQYITASNKQKIYIFESPLDEEMESETEEEEIIEEQTPQYSVNTAHYSSNVYNEEETEEAEESGEEETHEHQMSPEETKLMLMKSLVTKLFDLQETMQDMDGRLKVMSQQIAQIESIQKKRGLY